MRLDKEERWDMRSAFTCRYTIFFFLQSWRQKDWDIPFQEKHDWWWSRRTWITWRAGNAPLVLYWCSASHWEESVQTGMQLKDSFHLLNHLPLCCQLCHIRCTMSHVHWLHNIGVVCTLIKGSTRYNKCAYMYVRWQGRLWNRLDSFETGWTALIPAGQL